jgi:hypothetical protein
MTARNEAADGSGRDGDGSRWPGEYMVVNRPELGWNPCWVLNVTGVGVDIELRGPWPNSAAEDPELIVRLDAWPGEPAEAVQLRGVVRQSRIVKSHRLRVELEFVGEERAAFLRTIGTAVLRPASSA